MNILTTNKRYLLALLGCLIITSVNAQLASFKAQPIDQTKGLSQDKVTSLLQDSKGFVWIGTETGGLDRYDGYTFKHHKYNPDDPNSIAGNYVETLFEDSKGFIWAGLRGDGLSRYSPRTHQFNNYTQVENDSTKLTSETVLCLVEDKLGQIWVGTGWGLCMYNESTDNFSTILKNNLNIHHQSITTLINVDDDHIMVGTYTKGMYLFDIHTKKVVKSWRHDPNNPNSISSDKIRALMIDSEDQLWCGTGNKGMSRFKSINSNEVIHISVGRNDTRFLASKVVEDIYQDTNGNIWITGRGGVGLIAKDEITNEQPHIKRYQTSNDIYSISHNMVYNVLEDRDGSFWIRTHAKGVDYITVKNNNFTHYQYHENGKNTITGNLIRDVLKQDNKIFIAIQGGGLNIYNTSTKRYTQHWMSKENPKTLCSNWVHTIEKFNENYLAVGTNKGVCYFDTIKKSFVRNLEGRDVSGIALDTNNNILWLGGQNGTFVIDINKSGSDPTKYVDEDYRKVGVKNSLLFCDSKSRVWAGSWQGLYLYNDTAGVTKYFNYEKGVANSISGSRITSISEDDKNRIWVATSNGLNIFREDSLDFVTFNEWDGLPDNEIHNVFCDINGKMWISSNKGLTRFEYNPNAKRKNEMLVNLLTFKVKDGLQGNLFDQNCFSIGEDGEVIIGGFNGYNSFYPDKLSFNTIKPRLGFTDFLLFNKSIDIDSEDAPLKEDIAYADEIVLNHKQTAFSILYSAFNYTVAEKCEYAYMMEGLDDTWNYVGKTRQANYNNLKAGDYLFKVKASNNDGLWADTETVIKVTVLPPWWSTWWFRTIVVLIVIAATYTFVKNRMEQVTVRRKELETKVREATEESESKNARLEEAKQRLSSIMEEVKSRLGKTSTELMDATNSQAASIEEISSSIDQMTTEINESATGVAKMTSDVKVVEANSVETVEIFTKAVDAIADISKSISFIQGFARTTNILSLNAAIEAAKAGEYGKSFAVVATEVKKLAENSQEVAVDIKKLSDAGLKQSKDANEKIVMLQDYIKNIVAVISQISDSSQSQSYEAANVNSAIQQISNYISETATLAEQLDEAIKSLSIE